MPSGSPLLVGLPAEILVIILRGCHDFTDLVAFSSTCSRLNSLWKSNVPSILDSIAPRCILAFDEALVAVRGDGLSPPAVLFLPL